MDESTANRDVVHWLILLRVPGLSPRKITELLTRYTQPAHIINAGRDELIACGLSPDAIEALRHPDRKSIDADCEWLSAPGNTLVTIKDESYPPLLRQIHDPPPVLFVRGNPEVLATPQFSIVGTRNPTPGGKRTARRFARELGLCGLTITSGLAAGIDAAAHTGAVDAGAATIAVLGCGPDVIYPRVNRELAGLICGKGALLSEFPPGTQPLPGNFPRRNRLISGLSVGTLVVEAALNSGSLITARLAMEQGREVFAIPGSIANPMTRGCHALLRDGAKLTEQTADVLEEIGRLYAVVRQSGFSNVPQADGTPYLDGNGKVLLDNIGYEPVTIDTLVEETGISANAAAAVLLNLELQDLIESLPGGGYVRKN
jgi:DNA processing protein